MRTLEKPIEHLEQALKGNPEQCPDCICFPQSEQPFFATRADQELAAKIKCPTHGDRFQPRLHIFLARWRLESEKVRWLRLSSQYHKAWHATFPPGSWPETSLDTSKSRCSVTLLLVFLAASTQLHGQGARGEFRIEVHEPQAATLAVSASR